MKVVNYSFLAALLLGGAALSGCSPDGEPEVTPEQQAELDQSREDLKKRGWIDLKPVPPAEQPAEVDAGEAESDEAEEDPFEGSGLPASELPPTD